MSLRGKRKMFKELGWKTMVRFQARNLVYQAREYVQKITLEMVVGLQPHPFIGETKKMIFL
ncbi:hypothetical protein CN907_26785 [Bacillus anthracis]|nr:hypothetical protein CN907_26785 [Bacillus anthracis]